MKMKICITTWYDSINYGTCIQCYALVEYLRSKGFNTVVPNSYKYYYGINHPIETIRSAYKKIASLFISKNTYYDNDLIKQRIKKNSEFAKNQTKIEIIDSKKQFIELIDECDSFISGSDQIWNPKHVTPPMLLSYAPGNKNKIAYGSSFGVSELPKTKTNFYKKYLTAYNHIGVRELDGQKIVKKIANKDSKVVLDPSFLLNKEQWEKVSLKPKYIKDEDFVFSYFIGNNERSKSEIANFCKKLNLPAYYAVSESMVTDYYGVPMIDIGVEEFIWCILNAKYIITDSFHAAALSLNFNKNFFVFKRFNDSDVSSQNSRIYNLMDTFNVNDNMESDNNKLNNITKQINYAEINKKLGKLRIDSSNFLLHSLGDK